MFHTLRLVTNLCGNQSIVFKIASGKRKKDIFKQNQFFTKSILFIYCNSKTNNLKYLSFSLNIYVIIFYTFLKIFWLFLNHLYLGIKQVSFIYSFSFIVHKSFFACESWEFNTRFIIIVVISVIKKNSWA